MSGGGIKGSDDDNDDDESVVGWSRSLAFAITNGNHNISYRRNASISLAEGGGCTSCGWCGGGDETVDVRTKVAWLYTCISCKNCRCFFAFDTRSHENTVMVAY